MGAAIKKTEAAGPAASVTTTPEVQNPATVPLELYNQAMDIAEGQGVRIAALEAEVVELQGDIRAANHTIAELTQELDQAEGTILNLAHQVSPVTVLGTVEETIDAPAEPKTTFDYNGRTYGFVKDTPARLFHDDKAYTLEELLNDPEAMTTLIVGENGFIKQIH